MATQSGLKLWVCLLTLIGLNYLQWNINPLGNTNSCPAGFSSVQTDFVLKEHKDECEHAVGMKHLQRVVRRGSVWSGREFVLQVKSRAPGRVWRGETGAGSGAEGTGDPWGRWDGWQPVSPILRKGQSRTGHPVRETEQQQNRASGNGGPTNSLPGKRDIDGTGWLHGSAFTVLPICNWYCKVCAVYVESVNFFQLGYALTY